MNFATLPPTFSCFHQPGLLIVIGPKIVFEYISTCLTIVPSSTLVVIGVLLVVSKIMQKFTVCDENNTRVVIPI